eukprot:4923593-Prymnesium_polylepis.2
MYQPSGLQDNLRTGGAMHIFTPPSTSVGIHDNAAAQSHMAYGQPPTGNKTTGGEEGRSVVPYGAE